MSLELEQQLQALQAENQSLRQQLEQKTEVAAMALPMEIIRQKNDDLDQLAAGLTQAKQLAEAQARETEATAQRLLLVNASLETEIAERKQAEQALQRQQELLTKIIENLPVGIFTKDVRNEYRFSIWNAKMEAFFGVNREAMLGKNDYDLFETAAEADSYRQIDVAVLEGGQVVDIPLEEVTTNRGAMLAHTVKIPIYDSEGQPEILLGILEDITERKRAEEDLLKFKLGIERSNDAFFLTDTNGVIIYANPAFEKIYGFSREETIGQTPRIIKSGFIPPERYQHFWATLLAKESVAGELVNKAKDGRIVHIAGNNTPILDERENITGFLAVHRDITVQKQAQETLRQNEALLRNIIDATPDWIFIKDREHRFRLVNQSFANSVHLTPADILGKTDLDLGIPEEVVKGNPEKGIRGFWADDLEVMTSGQTKFIAEEPTVIEGQPAFLSTVKSPLSDAKGEVWGLLVFIHNITERKQTEEVLARRAAELETVAQVSTATATILEADTLLQEVVNLTKRSFGLYHAHIYLLNEAGNTLRLAAGAGEVGRQMVAQGWHIPMGQEQSLVTKAARSRQGIIVNNVGQEPGFLPNPLLPETRAEMAVPLIAGEQMLGVLDVQADKTNYFTQDDLRIFTTLTAQISVALQNARLFAQAQRQTRQEQVLREITARVRNSTDPDIIIRAAVRELGQALDRPTFIRLGSAERLRQPQPPEPDGQKNLASEGDK